MAVAPLATPGDLAEWMGAQESPANAVSLLRAASGLVRGATAGCVYQTTDDGLARDAVTRGVLRDAACAQAAAWVALGVDPSAGIATVPESSGVVSSTSIGTASVSYATASEGEVSRAGRDRAATLTTLVPQALDVLRDDGMLTARVLAW